MHITQLELKNFAGFEDFSINFPEKNICVFIGENGSGKTSILEAIYCLIVRSKIDDKSFYLFRQQIAAQKRNVSSGENTNLLSFLELNWGEDLLYLQFMSKEIEWKEFKTKIKNASNQKNLFTTIDLSIANSDFIKNLTEDFFIYAFEKFSTWYKELSLYDVYITKKRKTDYSPKQAVDEAIKRFSGIIVDTEIGESIHDLQVIFWKEGKKLSLHHLSQGEQKTINLIGQIIDAFVPPLKEDTGDILDFEGIVLIDEIETHLHPRWQREILPNLAKTFPNVQFIVTTHSPQVVSTVPRECVFLLKDFKAVPVTSFTEGKDSNTLLREIFDVAERPAEDMQLLADFYTAINHKSLAQAQTILAKMRNKWGGLDAEVVRAELDVFDLQEEILIVEGE